ncbi:hypothetical protein L0222_28575, partial [bacterium]|nr:hypothetical protein [bacterium]
LPGKCASVDETDFALDAFDYWNNQTAGIETIRSADIMRWRYDKRSGLEYGKARLRESEQPNAIVFRIVKRRGMRILIVYELIGSELEKTMLARSISRHHRVLAMLFASQTGAFPSIGGASLKHGGSTLAVLPLREISPDPLVIGNWSLTLGDLESVI